MTREAAAQLLGRLCMAMDRHPNTLRQDQLQLWLAGLEQLSEADGQAAIEHIIQTWRGGKFPPPGMLSAAVQRVRQARQQAAAYSQPTRTPITPEEARRAMERQDSYLEMDDAEYLDLLRRMGAAVYGA